MSHNQYQQSYTERLDNGANTAINGNELSENFTCIKFGSTTIIKCTTTTTTFFKKKSRRPVRAFHTEFNSPIPTTSSTPAFPSSPIVAGYPQNYASGLWLARSEFNWPVSTISSCVTSTRSPPSAICNSF